MTKFIKTFITLFVFTIQFTLLSIHCQSQVWKQLNSGTTEPLMSVYFVDSLTGWVAGNYGGIYKTTDGGKSWLNQNTSIPCRLQSIFFTDRRTGIAVGRSGVILKTIDGGLNWIRKDTGVSYNIYNSVFFIDINIGYIVGNLGIILKTIDGGDNWTEQKYGSSYLINSLRSVCFTDIKIGFAVGSNIGGYGLIVRTTDGGENWVVQDSVVQGTFTSVFFPTKEIGYIVSAGYPGYILKTMNRGDLWYPITYFGELSCSFNTKDDGFIVGGGGRIYQTKDGGLNWIDQSIGYDIFLYSVFSLDKYTSYISGDNGIILKYQDTTVSNGELRIGNGELKILPNPANEILNVEFLILNKDYVNIKIIDMTSREIITLVNEIKEKGNYEYRFNTENLKNGIYIYRLITGNNVITKKFIKM